MPMGLGMPRTFLVLPVPASDPAKKTHQLEYLAVPQSETGVCKCAFHGESGESYTIPARENTKLLSRDWTTGESRMMT